MRISQKDAPIAAARCIAVTISENREAVPEIFRTRRSFVSVFVAEIRNVAAEVLLPRFALWGGMYTGTALLWLLSLFCKIRLPRGAWPICNNFTMWTGRPSFGGVIIFGRSFLMSPCGNGFAVG